MSLRPSHEAGSPELLGSGSPCLPRQESNPQRGAEHWGTLARQAGSGAVETPFDREKGAKSKRRGGAATPGVPSASPRGLAVLPPPRPSILSLRYFQGIFLPQQGPRGSPSREDARSLSPLCAPSGWDASERSRDCFATEKPRTPHVRFSARLRPPPPGASCLGAPIPPPAPNTHTAKEKRRQATARSPPGTHHQELASARSCVQPQRTARLRSSLVPGMVRFPRLPRLCPAKLGLIRAPCKTREGGERESACPGGREQPGAGELGGEAPRGAPPPPSPSSQASTPPPAPARRSFPRGPRRSLSGDLLSFEEAPRRSDWLAPSEVTLAAGTLGKGDGEREEGGSARCAPGAGLFLHVKCLGVLPPKTA